MSLRQETKTEIQSDRVREGGRLAEKKTVLVKEMNSASAEQD